MFLWEWISVLSFPKNKKAKLLSSKMFSKYLEIPIEMKHEFSSNRSSPGRGGPLRRSDKVNSMKHLML